MLALNKVVKANIEKSVGKKTKVLSTMTIGEIQRYLENVKKKKFKDIALDDPRLIGRGSVYITLHRFIDSKTIEKKLSKI